MKQQYSSLKALFHTDRLSALRENKPVAPIYIRLKPTNRCNHHCSYCSYGGGADAFLTANRDQVHHGDMIPWPKLEEIITDFGRMGLKALTFSGGGEPLSYPHILDAIRLTKAQGIDVACITNGSLLAGDTARELCDARWVRVSFDAANAATYAESRGVPEKEFERVCTNLGNFAKSKSADCVLGINFIITQTNAAQVYEAVKLLHGLGVDNVKLSGVLANSKGYHDDIHESVCAQIELARRNFVSDSFAIVSDYQRNYEDRQFATQPFHRCYICQLMTSVCADSKVYYCFMRAYDSHALLGDLRQQSFYDFWFSAETQQKLRTLDPAKECKNQCVYDGRNLLIEDYLNTDMRHVNFI